MRISIDGNSYELTPETQHQLLQQLQAFEIEAYHSLDEALRFLLKPVARHLLEKTERKLRASIGKEEAARICRPERREDPVIRFLGLNMAFAQSMLGNATLTIETGSDNTITNATIQAPREGGGPLALNGDQRERENDGAEIPGRGVYETLPGEPALCPGQQDGWGF